MIVLLCIFLLSHVNAFGYQVHERDKGFMLNFEVLAIQQNTTYQEEYKDGLYTIRFKNLILSVDDINRLKNFCDDVSGFSLYRTMVTKNPTEVLITISYDSQQIIFSASRKESKDGNMSFVFMVYDKKSLMKLDQQIQKSVLESVSNNIFFYVFA